MKAGVEVNTYLTKEEAKNASIARKKFENLSYEQLSEINTALENYRDGGDIIDLQDVMEANGLTPYDLVYIGKQAGLNIRFKSSLEKGGELAIKGLGKGLKWLTYRLAGEFLWIFEKIQARRAKKKIAKEQDNVSTDVDDIIYEEKPQFYNVDGKMVPANKLAEDMVKKQENERPKVAQTKDGRPFRIK